MLDTPIFDGRELTIDHLASRIIPCPCPNIARDLAIRVTFSDHCYTESFDPERHDRTQIIVGGDRPRVLCPIRHRLSFRLPEIVKGLPGRKVYQTAERRNYLYAAPMEIEDQDYEVYFMLARAERMKGIDLRMTVESAYPVDAPTPRPRRPNAIRFQILAYRLFRREGVRFAPR